MWNFFKRSAVAALPYQVDIHSHLLPSLDDGVKSEAEALAVIELMMAQGVQKIITTPHIMHDTYRNSAETILPAYERMQEVVQKNSLSISFEVAAEYYLDEELLRKLETNQPLLTFGKNFLLFETNYLTEPYQLKDFIFKATTRGYRVILAHPERYHYMTLSKAEELRDRGVLLQLNLLSLIGFYMKPVQSMAYKLVEKGLVDFLGSDCHNTLQAQLLPQVLKNKYFRKAMELPLLNNTLLA